MNEERKIAITRIRDLCQLLIVLEEAGLSGSGGFKQKMKELDKRAQEYYETYIKTEKGGGHKR